ncbi:adenylyl-sulfate kinase [Acidithiobacillus caldus]|jgi:sulfate adenylyltransferase|uniref:Adenylyl-sulfate kinase n=6 Tax=Acidithiobacillus TaxID=119977 RepID=F9ZRN4_ACICS|nr:adenylyl-sulfate kinase [Acidithiobacillus caldus]AEK58855.1 Sulfate adenylyltransferase, dissimilatory-type / Adenylylsulfate kinase [Acidithiobacillus caldus SM-1]AIA55906.1 Sulfate adenylyltransferase / Adenylylsulfate kinase [Acidithiobacillus caldus ATCC 51756]AUW33266.1 adenylyl-sulfate kinase [Acidithiobacillus caldus]MBU2737034.1 adenylyl-sulfate kinase [Acidithiobacillus caldus ATCC 51756]MBU2744511.1 adenylyl-sulfate kinase [Acidithiobacillus caldus]
MATPDSGRAALPTADAVHVLSERQRCDLELLLSGAFAPVTEFMDEPTWESVCAHQRLPDGRLWPMPLTLEVDEATAAHLGAGAVLRLERNDGTPLARMTVASLYRPDRLWEVQHIYGSSDRRHPGVAETLERLPVNIAGSVVPWEDGALERAAAVDFPPEYRAPAQVRTALAGAPALAFQTRNPLHNAHIAITRAALERLGSQARLLLHPAIGPTRPGDVEASWRMRAYRAVLDHYPRDRVLLSPLPLAMRMAGPREALWHALIRRNFGASHFLIGRGHADPGHWDGGLFYPPFAAQEWVAAHREELGIEPVFMPEYAYSRARQSYVPAAEANGERLEGISGSELRRRLAANEDIPSWFSPPEVIRILRQAYRGADRRGLVLWFTGLSASGKSTLAGMLARQLEIHDERAVTLLDGDVVRRFLSKGLGFGREDRDENIRRIGFVASLVARHGGIAIVAAISPYRDARAEARRLVEEAGGAFVEIHVATPLSVCAARDPKGLYARALAGEIASFTGVDDPYEAPEHPDIAIDTSHLPGQAALRLLLDKLTDLGILGQGGDHREPGP